MTAIQIELSVNQLDATGSGKSKMAASKLQICLSQFVNKIATKFQRQYLCFCGPYIQ